MLKKLPILKLVVLILICNSKLFGQAISDNRMAGDVCFAKGKFKLAITNYDKAIKEHDTKDKYNLAVLYYKRGLAQDSLKQYDEAITDYSTSISLNPEIYDVYWSRGVLYDSYGRNNYQLAIDDYAKAISLVHFSDSNLSVLNSNIANDEYMLRDIKKAQTADSIAISYNSNNNRAYSIRGSIHLYLKEYQLAIDDYTTAINTYHSTNKNTLAALYVDRATAKNHLMKNKDAINDFSFAILLNSNNRIAYWNRAAAYHANGDYQLAADDYTKAMSYYQDDKINLSKLYNDRASNEFGQSLLTNAIKDDSVAIELDGNNKNAYLLQADAYTQNGDYQNGIDRYKQALAFYNDNIKLQAVIYFLIANNEYFLGEYNNVISDCTHAISLNNNYSSPYFYRAKVYLKKMHSKDKALTDFNEVLALDTAKKTSDYVFSLYYTGNGEKAVSILQNNLLNEKENEGMLADYYNMACLYSLMNNVDEANTYLKIAIDKGYSKKFAAADEDLDNIRNSADYKSLMNGSSATN